MCFIGEKKDYSKGIRVVKIWRFVQVALFTWGAGSPLHQAQQLHLSDAPLQMQPWAHLTQPAGQQEQQLFLQVVHLHSLHLQEPAQVQEPPVAQEQLGSMARLKRWPKSGDSCTRSG